MSSILLKNGLVLLHSADDECPKVEPHEGVDVLIEGPTIAKVGPNINAPAGATMIDCSGKIVTPGFVSTHSHLWPSQLKGIHADQTLFDYMPTGNFMSAVYNPNDSYWGQLAGCLEAINAGTTTVLDHAHGCRTTEHMEACAQATIDSGMRCIWAYAEPIRLESWTQSECVPSMAYFQEPTMSCLEKLTQKHNSLSSTGPFKVGFAADTWFLPTEFLKAIHDRVTAAGVTTWTTHLGRDAILGLGEPFTLLKNKAPFLFERETRPNGVGIDNLIVSHAVNIQESEFDVLFSPKASDWSRLNISISTTPETESHMCMHRSVAFSHHSTCPVPTDKVSMGIDCHTAASSFMPHAVRLGLANARIRSNEILFREEKYAKKLLGNSGSEAFNSFTVNGAKALGLDHDNGGIGRIRPGRKADIVIFDAADSINMGTGVDIDPVVAITRFSEMSDIDTVIIDGVIKKQNKKLTPIQVSAVAVADISGKENASWKDIKKELSRSYRELQIRVAGVSMDRAKDMAVQMFHIDKSKFIDIETSI